MRLKTALIGLFLLVGVFIFPNDSHAIVLSQPIYSDTEGSYAGDQDGFYQGLGSNFVSTTTLLSQVRVRHKWESGRMIVSYSMSILSCSSPYTNCTVAHSVNSVASTSLSMGQTGYVVADFRDPGQPWAFSSSTAYYMLWFDAYQYGPGSDDREYRTQGTSYDSFSNGACYRNNTGTAMPGLADCYFEILFDGATFDEEESYPGDVACSESGTCIEVVVPFDGEVLATTTGNRLQTGSGNGFIGTYGSISEADYVDDMWIEQTIFRNQDSQLAITSPSLVTQYYTWDVTSSGVFDVSTTTAVWDGVGRYRLQTFVKKPWVSFFGFGFGEYTITSKTTYFIASTTTAYDDVQDQFEEGVATLADNVTNATEYCTIATFDFVKCTLAIFIPNSATISGLIAQAKNGFLSAYPWGYVTRLVTIATGTATSSLSTITFTAPASVQGNAFPVSATLVIDPWSNLPTNPDSPFYDTQAPNGDTFRESVESYWNMVVLAMFGLAVIRLITGIRVDSKDPDDDWSTTETVSVTQRDGSTRRTIASRRKL